MADEPEEEMARRRRQAVLGQGLRKLYNGTAEQAVPNEFFDLLRKAGDPARKPPHPPKPPRPANDHSE